ncbi:hypothetical protein BJ980_001454 [Nocardioides daedukensis]|uniref:Sensor domain-containing protein n=1 Tax=Nocardioides daedukensis TaxID=634462 RepID=A0A7Y9RZV1_9ACTN|nr:hypothetical protein [Nocardioides daedukensis]NYG58531.1 hypothetical protein [Nocardioides daedukensis]
MSSPLATRRAHPLPLALAGLGLAALLTGCGEYTGEEPSNVASDPSATASPSESPSESPTASESPSQSPTASESATASGPEGMLLTAEEMPGLSDATTWTEESTEPQGLEADGSSAVGACQLTPLHDIGATEAIQRTFSGPEGATATQVIATLADDKSVRQTHQVLVSWHDKCESTIEGSSVTELEEVTVPTGTAESYVVSYGSDAEASTWESVAINVSGTHISLVVIENQGMDYNYEKDKTPAVLAAKAVADKLS